MLKERKIHADYPSDSDCFTAMYPDVKQARAVPFLRDAVAWYASLGVRICRLLTDNGSAFYSRESARAC